jgi:methylated-DNA-[protein]-cysteine S-methyltransferase
MACSVAARRHKRQDGDMRPSLSFAAEHHTDQWDPSHTGYALFATRLGICGMAWGAQGVIAVQLPEPSVDATRERMLRGASRRRVGDYLQALSATSLSEAALQTVAGVQVLLGGRTDVASPAVGSTAGQAAGPDNARWAFAQPQLTAAGAVLPDLRAQFQSTRWAPKGQLPLLDDVLLDWTGVSEFHRHVYQLALAIAPGHTRSYGDLAAELGGKGLSRAVGQALGSNPFAPVVPCHRILAAQGASGGFSATGGALTKLRMLEWEGAALGDSGNLPLFG